MLGCSPISNECVSEDEGLRKEILSKAHHSSYTIHSGSTKMYKDEERSGLELSTYLFIKFITCDFWIATIQSTLWS